jgi:ankyrin repeat protein
MGHLDMVRCFGMELGAVNQAKHNGATPMIIAAQMKGHLDVVLCKELGADVNQARHDGPTPLFMAAQQGHLDVVRCLGKELGADVNQA